MTRPLPGARLRWRHVPRGGYGFASLVPVVVERLTDVRAVVRVEATGERRTVAVRNLRPMRSEG